MKDLDLIERTSKGVLAARFYSLIASKMQMHGGNWYDTSVEARQSIWLMLGYVIIGQLC